MLIVTKNTWGYWNVLHQLSVRFEEQFKLDSVIVKRPKFVLTRSTTIFQNLSLENVPIIGCFSHLKSPENGHYWPNEQSRSYSGFIGGAPRVSIFRGAISPQTLTLLHSPPPLFSHLLLLRTSCLDPLYYYLMKRCMAHPLLIPLAVRLCFILPVPALLALDLLSDSTIHSFLQIPMIQTFRGFLIPQDQGQQSRPFTMILETVKCDLKVLILNLT